MLVNWLTIFLREILARCKTLSYVKLKTIPITVPTRFRAYRTASEQANGYRESRAAKQWRVTVIYTVSKKTSHQTPSHNFTNYYPIFKIFSPAHSLVNL